MIDAIVCNLVHIQLLDRIDYKAFFERLVVLETRVSTARAWLSKKRTLSMEVHQGGLNSLLPHTGAGGPILGAREGRAVPGKGLTM